MLSCMLPLECTRANDFEIIMLGLPAQTLFNGTVVRYQAGGVPRSPAGFLDLKVLAADLAHHLEHFAHAVAMTIAAIEDG